MLRPVPPAPRAPSSLFPLMAETRGYSSGSACPERTSTGQRGTTPSSGSSPPAGSLAPPSRDGCGAGVRFRYSGRPTWRARTVSCRTRARCSRLQSRLRRQGLRGGLTRDALVRSRGCARSQGDGRERGPRPPRRRKAWPRPRLRRSRPCHSALASRAPRASPGTARSRRRVAASRRGVAAPSGAAPRDHLGLVGRRRAGAHHRAARRAGAATSVA